MWVARPRLNDNAGGMLTAIGIVIVGALVVLLVVTIARSESRRLRELRGYAPLDHTASPIQSADTWSSGSAGTWSAGQWVALSMLANQNQHHHHHHHHSEPADEDISGAGAYGEDRRHGDVLGGSGFGDGTPWDGNSGGGMFGDGDGSIGAPNDGVF